MSHVRREGTRSRRSGHGEEPGKAGQENRPHACVLFVQNARKTLTCVTQTRKERKAPIQLLHRTMTAAEREMRWMGPRTGSRAEKRGSVQAKTMQPGQTRFTNGRGVREPRAAPRGPGHARPASTRTSRPLRWPRRGFQRPCELGFLPMDPATE